MLIHCVRCNKYFECDREHCVAEMLYGTIKECQCDSCYSKSGNVTTNIDTYVKCNTTLVTNERIISELL